MGLDAYVECNCLKEGKAKPPPFDISLVEWTDEGIDVSPTVDDKTYYLFVNWRKHACEHENFKYYHNRVANIAGSNFLFGVMQRLGREDYSLLNSIWNKPVDAVQAGKALEELNTLESRINVLQGVFLVESQSQKEYVKALPGDDGWFYAAGSEYTYRLNERGFYIVDRNSRELFRSMAFSQEVIDSQEDGRVHPLVRFQDNVTGYIHEASHPFSTKTWGVDELYYPTSLQVVIRELRSSDLPSVEVLRELFEVSLTTGNPIIWT